MLCPHRPVRGHENMSRMRGTALKRKKNKTGKIARKPEKTGRRSRRDRDDDDDDGDARSFGPPPKKDNSALIVILGVVAVVLIIGAVAVGGGGGASLPEQHEAEKAYNLVEGWYAQAKGGDCLADCRAQIRAKFENVARTFPDTEFGQKAAQRAKELQ